jgi:hypothetical protein
MLTLHILDTSTEKFITRIGEFDNLKSATEFLRNPETSDPGKDKDYIAVTTQGYWICLDDKGWYQYGAEDGVHQYPVRTMEDIEHALILCGRLYVLDDPIVKQNIEKKIPFMWWEVDRELFETCQDAVNFISAQEDPSDYRPYR